MKTVDGQLGAVARPARIHFVSLLPKTRSADVAPRDPGGVRAARPGDLTTMDDPTALQQIRDLVAASDPGPRKAFFFAPAEGSTALVWPVTMAPCSRRSRPARFFRPNRRQWLALAAAAPALRAGRVSAPGWIRPAGW